MTKIKRPQFGYVLMLATWLMIYILNVLFGIYGAGVLFICLALPYILIVEYMRAPQKFDVSLIFISSCIFFYCIGFYLWPLSSLSPLVIDGIVYHKFTTENIDYACTLAGASVSITYIAFSMFRLRFSDEAYAQWKISEEYFYSILYRVGAGIFIITLPFIFYELWVQFQFIRSAGYLALYTDLTEITLFSKIVQLLSDFGFFLVVAFSRNKKSFLIFSGLYLATAALDSLKGVRGTVIVTIIFLAWFYRSRYGVGAFNVRRHFVIAFAIMLFFIGITISRSSDYENSASLFRFVIDIFSSQGRSLQWLALYEQYKSEVASYGNFVVVSNLLMPFQLIFHPELRTAPPSMDFVIYSNNFKHIFTYVLNDLYYFAGGGTGSVYVIELVESGFVGFSVLSFALGVFLAWFPTAMRYPFVRFISLPIFFQIFYLPRAEFFPNMSILGKYIILYLVLLFFIRLIFGSRSGGGSTAFRL